MWDTLAVWPIGSPRSQRRKQQITRMKLVRVIVWKPSLLITTHLLFVEKIRRIISRQWKLADEISLIGKKKRTQPWQKKTKTKQQQVKGFTRNGKREKKKKTFALPSSFCSIPLFFRPPPPRQFAVTKKSCFGRGRLSVLSTTRPGQTMKSQIKVTELESWR